MSQSITFHGAARTVTGSRHLLNLNGKLVLVDCGLFQGERELRERNWEPFPIDATEIDAIIITHAHTDHIGYLPKLVAQGYRGPIIATPGTIGICRISLPDSGRLQEEEARHANKHGYSRHKPALPLYNEKDAFETLKLFEPLRYRELRSIPGKAQFRFLPAGHILGSAFAEVYFENGERILMGGDLGRYDVPIITDPTTVENAEYVVLESTYGDREHGDQDPEEVIERVFKEAIQNGSVVLIPSFAIGRTQELLYHIGRLQDAERLPRIPIFLDSPMASSATEIYDQSLEDHDVDMRLLRSDGQDPLHPKNVQVVRDANQSKAINSMRGPMVVISGSGMATGGRIVHHLKQRLDDPSTIVLFTGFQGAGTLGRQLVDGAQEVRIHGQEFAVRAQIERMTSLSAHADRSEILRWLGGFQTPPRKTFLVHGEYEVQLRLQQTIREELGWQVEIPEQGQKFDL